MRTVSLVMLIFLSGSVAARAETYMVTGQMRGFFCRYLGFVCSFKQVDAVSFGDDALHHVTSSFPAVTDFKEDKGTSDSGRCWINTKTSEQDYGWLAAIKDKITGVPVFHALKPDGTYDNLGTPDFVVFACRRVS